MVAPFEISYIGQVHVWVISYAYDNHAYIAPILLDCTICEAFFINYNVLKPLSTHVIL